MHIQTTLLVLICLAVCSKSQKQVCEANTDIQNLFQDSLTIRLDKIRYKHTYNYPSIIFPSSKPKIALSLTKMQIKQMSNIEYHIATIFGSGGSVIFYFIFPSGNAKWREIRVKLWLIGQEMQDMSVGHALFENINPSSHKNSILTYKEQGLLDKLNKGQASDPQVFISTILGLSASFTMDYLQIKNEANIKAKLVNPQQKQYEIQLVVQTGLHSSIKLIRFCYILYAPSRLSANRHHYGSITKQQSQAMNNGLITSRTILQPLTIYPLKYQIMGITALKLTNLQTFSLSIQLLEGHLDLIQLESVSKVDSIKINYLVIGVDMMMSCIHCPDSFVQSVQQSTICVSRRECADNQIPVMDKDAIYYSCRKCVANSIVLKKEDGSKYCGCPGGYSLEADGTCKKIEVFKSLYECSDPNSIRDPVTGRCICKEGFVPDQFGFCGGTCNSSTSYWDLNTEKCACFQGFQFNALQNACVQKGKNCGTNQIFIDGKCQCDGFTVKSQSATGIVCKQCGSGTYKADDANQCRPCESSCRQCISSIFCLACSRGYFFRDFRCWPRCGDGFKITKEECDDGNLLDEDGCNSECKIQEGYQCKQDLNGRSICGKKQSNTVTINTNQPQVQPQTLILTPSQIQVQKQSKQAQPSVQPVQSKNETTKTSNSTNSTQISINSTQVSNSTVASSSVQIQNNNSTQINQSSGYVPVDQTPKKQQSQNIATLNIKPSSNSSSTPNNTLTIPAPKNQTRTQMNATNVTPANLSTPTPKPLIINASKSQAQQDAQAPSAPVDPSTYKLSVSKNSPIYLSSGIAIELLVKPQKKRTQDQLNKMFKIQVSDKRALPPAIYISQDKNKLSSIRCYMHYNNQLPVIDFSIKVWARFTDQVWKSLTIYSKVFAKMSRSIKPMDDQSYIM